MGKLGQRPHRRTRLGKANGTSIESLTERELQVARLVVDRRTNPEIAAELFLSRKTVETHLRNIFNKMDVTTRVALARAVERADRTASPRPRLGPLGPWSSWSSSRRRTGPGAWFACAPRDRGGRGHGWARPAPGGPLVTGGFAADEAVVMPGVDARDQKMTCIGSAGVVSG